MKHVKIKVCGMTRDDQVTRLTGAGVDYVGLIFYEKSPRFVAPDSSLSLLKSNGATERVGVFVNAPLGEVLEKVKAYHLSLVQLHGDEAPLYCGELRMHVPVIKAFRIHEATEINEMVKPYIAVCDYFLFDTAGTLYGGNGRKFDWQLLSEYREGPRFFLSGGIGMEHVPDLCSFHHPLWEAIDVNSRFETEPGVKDMKLINEFIQQIKKQVQ